MNTTQELLSALITAYRLDVAPLNRTLAYHKKCKKNMRMLNQHSRISLHFVGNNGDDCCIELTEATKNYSFTKKQKYGRLLQQFDAIISCDIRDAERAIEALDKAFDAQCIVVIGELTR